MCSLFDLSHDSHYKCSALKNIGIIQNVLGFFVSIIIICIPNNLFL